MVDILPTKMTNRRDSESDHSNAKSDDENSGSEEEYVVEIVFDKRLKNGKIDFLLKWKGYESEYLGAKKLI